MYWTIYIRVGDLYIIIDNNLVIGKYEEGVDEELLYAGEERLCAGEGTKYKVWELYRLAQEW